METDSANKGCNARPTWGSHLPAIWLTFLPWPAQSWVSFHILYEAGTGVVCTPNPRPRDTFTKANNCSLKISVHRSLTEAGENKSIIWQITMFVGLPQLIQLKETLAGPSLLLCSVKPSREPKFQIIFSSSCQGYFDWYINDLRLLKMLRRQKPRRLC